MNPLGKKQNNVWLKNDNRSNKKDRIWIEKSKKITRMTIKTVFYINDIEMNRKITYFCKDAEK